MNFLIDSAIVFLLSLLISGNNSSLILGPLRSSGMMNKIQSGIFVSFFIALGFILEGGKMVLSVSYITHIPVYPAYILISSLIIFLIFSIFSVPLSAGMVFTGAIMGFALYNRSLNTSVWIIFISWIISFLLSLLIGYAIYGRMARRRGKVLNSRPTLAFFLFSNSFLSYTLGANTLGFIYAVDPTWNNFIVIIIGIFAGTIFLNNLTYSTVRRSIVLLNRQRAVVSQFSSSITVEAFTQAHMPVSITQGVIGSLVGTGISKGYREFNLSKVNQLLLSWAVTPLLSALLVMVLIVISPVL